MNGRPFAFAAVAAMLITSPLAAEPASKPDAAKPAAERPAPTLLAAADVRLGETAKVDTASAAKPRRNARVTTCRCADVASPQN